MKAALIFSFFILMLVPAFGQEATKNSTQTTPVIKTEMDANIDSIKNKLNNIENKVIKIGISLGFRSIPKNDQKYLYSPSISPIDSTLRLDKYKRESIVLSTELLITPFLKSSTLQSLIDEQNVKRLSIKKSGQKKGLGGIFFKKAVLKTLQGLTFIGTVNLITFQKAQSELSFNKQVDGGLGVGLRLSNNFWIGCCYEITNVRVLRNNIAYLENQVLKAGGKTVYQLDPTDDDFFISKGLQSFNLKFIFSL